MKNSILHQIHARYEQNVRKENHSFQKDIQISFEIFFHLFIKNVFMEIKNSICPPKYTIYGKNVEKNILFKKIYDFDLKYFFIGFIYFVYQQKILLKIKKLFFKQNATRNTKKI